MPKLGAKHAEHVESFEWEEQLVVAGSGGAAEVPIEKTSGTVEQWELGG